MLSFLKKLCLITFISILYHSAALTQTNVTNELGKNSVYLGAGLLPGIHTLINYERRIKLGKEFTWYGRTGIGMGGLIFNEVGPGGLGALTLLANNKKNLHFELSIGAFAGKGDTSNKLFIYPLADVGYRYQKPDGGFLFRFKFGILGIGVDLGYAF